MSITGSATDLRAPEGYSDEEEYPSPRTFDVPDWSEHYWFTAYDGASRHGVWVHLGRSPAAHLWREVVIVFRPDGQVLLSRSHARDHSDQPEGLDLATLQLRCEQPWSRWSTVFDGAAQVGDPRQLATGVQRDSMHHPVRAQLDWSGFSPVWAMPRDEMAKQHWGKSHYEQLVTATGTLDIDGETVAFSGTGIRDHTVGPRDYLHVAGHVCANCIFPESGRAFYVLDMEMTDGAHIRRAALQIDGQTVELPLREARRLAPGETPPASATLELGTDEQIITIEAEVVHEMPFGFTGYRDITFGNDPDVNYGRLFEGFSRFTWDGEVGYGMLERSVQDRGTRSVTTA